METIKIEMEQVNQYYGKKHVLKDVNLTIEKGMFGLLGRNGAGKTTLMKTLVTLLKKKSGHVTICGVNLDETAQIRSLVGYLPQDFTMYPNMTVMQSLAYLGLLSGLSKETIQQKSEYLLGMVNLLEHKNKKVKALSGGMKRRLGIAQALLHNPKVVIVDEPTAGLDPEERIRFRNLLSEIAEERIVLLSTHIVGDIEATCQRVAILHDGRVVYNGTVSSLLQAAAGKVYQTLIPSRELEAFKKNYYVTSMLIQGADVLVRFISEDQPNFKTQQVPPNMEDAYMYYIEKGQGQ